MKITDAPKLCPSFVLGRMKEGFVCFFFNFLFNVGEQLVNSVVTVSGGQQKGSAIHIHVSILPQTPLPSRLPYNIEKSSLCYTKAPSTRLLNTLQGFVQLYCTILIHPPHREMCDDQGTQNLGWSELNCGPLKKRVSLVAQCKESTCQCRTPSLITESRRSPGEGNGNLLQ